MTVESIAKEAAYSIIESMGFEPADVEYTRLDGDMCLIFYICSENGITSDDCESVSRNIEEAVDKADPTNGKPYCLCVSSWGDRAFKCDRDFERNLGKDVEVKLKKAVNGKKKKFTGKLVSFVGDSIVVQTKDGNTEFNKENIDTVRPYIGF